MTKDYTTSAYWGGRHESTRQPQDRDALKDLLDRVGPYLRSFENKHWIELGCSPGHVSALLHRRIPFTPSGVDFSPQAFLYKETMREVAGVDATLHQADVRSFIPNELFDVVMSFGLIEHFSDPQDILDHHYRICRQGGLVVVSIPNFRKLQWLYHFLFDRADLGRHNIESMKPGTFRTFAERRNLEILFLGYVGRMYFWNVDETGSRLIATVRKTLSLLVRALTNQVLTQILPRDRRLYAPWMVFVGRKL